jgi:hypothetical protein
MMRAATRRGGRQYRRYADSVRRLGEAARQHGRQAVSGDRGVCARVPRRACGQVLQRRQQGAAQTRGDAGGDAGDSAGEGEDSESDGV